MRKERTRISVGLLVLLVGTLGGGALAQEHPKGEHPKGEHPKEHPKENAKPGEKAGLTKDELGDAITAWVDSESKKSGGKLEVNDSVENKTLHLTLAKVHRERLASVAPETYFWWRRF